MGAWLRHELQPLIQDLLSKEQIEQRGLFRWTAIEKIVAAHQQQRSDHTDHLFALIALETWLRIYIDGQDRQMVPSRLSVTPAFISESKS